MATGVTFLWGCVGGFITAGFLYLLPSLTQALRVGDVTVTKRDMAVMASLLAFLSLTGGVVALSVDHATRDQAIKLGLASPAILKGIFSSFREAL